MRFGSVCSGIEAASVAWHPLSWMAAWLAEIEPFPSAVLAHHYPNVPNHGDMTKLPERIRSGDVEAPDVFCGGTPCQAFSVAGLRRSLDDARGNLSLVFCEIANEIDSARFIRGLQPATIFWENVPGVLNTKDNAFGCFLAGLAGEDDPIQPAGGKWSNAGCVYGPARAVAWRVLDAQYFGVAQRRRRVFVIASARDGFDPAAVLFEFDGLRRDTAPSRQAGQEIAPTIRAGASNGSAGHGARSGDSKEELIVPVTCMAHGQGGAGISENRSPTLTCNHKAPIAADEPYTLALRGREGLPQLEYRQDGTANALLTPNGGRGGIGVGAIAFHPTQDPISSYNVCHSIGANDNATAAIAFHPGNLARGAGSSPSEDVFPTLTSNHGRGRGDQDPHVAVRTISQTITSNYGKQVDSSDTALGPNVVFSVMQVRRLTPVECERLQGFPDGYTAIPWRKKPATDCPDGPRYKALGNSWAVPNVRWIGKRIDAHIRQLNSANDNNPSQRSIAL